MTRISIAIVAVALMAGLAFFPHLAVAFVVIAIVATVLLVGVGVMRRLTEI